MFFEIHYYGPNFLLQLFIFISYFWYCSEKDFGFPVDAQNPVSNFRLWRMNVQPKLIVQ